MPLRYAVHAAGALAALAAGCLSTNTRHDLTLAHQAAGLRLDRAAGADHASPELTGTLDRTLDRATVVAAAIAASPALAVMAHRARAMVHAGRAEGALPSAELGLEAWNLPLTSPYALGDADMYMIELRQRFPAAGSLDARARAMAKEAEAMLAELSAEEQMVAERAAMAYADYAQAVAEHALLTSQLALFERTAEALRARYTTGGAGLTEAARLEVELASARRARARNEGELASARAALNAMLRRMPSAPLGAPEAQPAQTTRLSIEELLALARAHQGSAHAATARHGAAAARRAAAEAEARHPELMLGLGYWQDPSMRPGLGITASMSLPWLWGPVRHRVAQAQEEEAALRTTRHAVELGTQTELVQVQARLVALEAQHLIVRTQSLPAARRSFEALTAALSTGGASPVEWVELARIVLELELELIALEGDLARTLASLQRTIGTELPLVPVVKDLGP